MSIDPSDQPESKSSTSRRRVLFAGADVTIVPPASWKGRKDVCKGSQDKSKAKHSFQTLSFGVDRSLCLRGPRLL